MFDIQSCLEGYIRPCGHIQMIGGSDSLVGILAADDRWGR